MDMHDRLCQDVVLLKAEVAELLLSNVMVDLAKRKNLDIDLCKLISEKVILLISLFVIHIDCRNL